MTAPSDRQRVFVFAGGGTGGHIFPALAIAEELRSVDGRPRSLFLCSDRPLDTEILTREKAEFRAVPAKPLVFSALGLARFAAAWGGAVRAARRAIRDAAQGGSRVELIAMGGFVAAPAVRAARAEGCRVTVVNLDAIPGKANRWIARRADRVFTAADARRPDWTLVRPIVRRVARGGDARDCRRVLGLNPEQPTLLVTGGSQGARSINQMLIALVRDHASAFRGWQIVHQCGKGEETGLTDAYGRAGVAAAVRAFLPEMGAAWGAADVAVSRAGAGSVGEAWANGVPTLFLPYPYHRDGHQAANAAPLVAAGAARLTEDLIDPGRNASGPGAVVLELLGDESTRARMRHAFEGLGPADGAATIARALREIDAPR